MYEEFPKRPINIKILLLKIGIIAVVAILIIIIFRTTTINTAPLSENAIKLKDNLELVSDASVKYFETEKLPEKLNESIKVNIDVLIDNEYLTDFEYDLDECIIKDSYVTLTNVKDNNYNLKTTLSCDDLTDYIIETIKIEDK